MLSSQDHNETCQSQPQHTKPQDLKGKKQDISHEINSRLSPSKTEELKSQGGESISQHKPFAPFLAKSLDLKTDRGFGQRVFSYNEKHNIIIACPDNKTIQFYNATTLLPLEGLKTKKLESDVVKMSFCEETETYLLGCFGGEVYAYNISNDLLQKIPEHPKSSIIAITSIHSEYYATSEVMSKQLNLGNLEDGTLVTCYSKNSGSVAFCNLPKKNLLFASLWDYSLVIYRTNQLPRLPILYSTRDGRDRCIEIHHVKINKKEYFVSNGTDKTIKIWHLAKGKIRLLRVIRLKERVYSMVYLENYKLLAVVQSSREVKFLSLPSGKIEKTLDLNLTSCTNVFFMKDKDAIGVTSSEESVIGIVQLHGGQEVK